MLTRPYLSLVAAIALFNAALLLSGCGNSAPGYEDKPPPAGGPSQSSEMPPGERAKADNAASPGAATR